MGDVLSLTEIQNILGKADTIQKAITTTAVTGLELRRQDLQSQMVMMAPVDAPLRARLRRTKGEGGAHEWYLLKPTAHTEGNFLGAGPTQMFFAAGGLPTLALPSYDHVSAPYKILGDLVSVSFHDQAAGRSYDDLLASQTRIKMLNVALAEEWCILNGNGTTSPLQFDGLDVLVTNTLNYATPTAYSLTAGATWLLQEFISLACERVANNGGMTRMAVYPYKVHTKLQNLLLQQMVNIWGERTALTGIAAGVSLKAFDFGWGPVDLVRSRYCPDYSYGSTIFLLDDSSLDNVNNGNVIQMVDLEPVNSVQLGLIATSWQRVIYEDTVLMVSAPNFQYKIINVV